MLSAQDAELIAIAVARALQQARSVSDSEHYDHHRWITEQISKDKWRQAFWKALAEHVIKWGAVSILSVLIYALWLLAKQNLAR